MSHQRDRQPLGWLIFHGTGPDGQPRETWIPNKPPNDLAYATQKAADLHGELLTAIADRRKP